MSEKALQGEKELDESWEQQLRLGLGKPPKPDFKAWCAAHPDAVASLISEPELSHPPFLRSWITSLKFFLG